jgi:hypothetical protein
LKISQSKFSLNFLMLTFADDFGASEDFLRLAGLGLEAALSTLPFSSRAVVVLDCNDKNQ